MKQSFLVVALMLLCCCFGYTQRNAMNRSDRQYLCAKVNQYLGKFSREKNKEYVNENDPFLLGDEFAINLQLKEDTKEAMEKALNDKGFMLAAGLYLSSLKEFPQYKKISVGFNNVIKIYSVNFKDHTLSFYDDRINGDRLVNLSEVANCNCF